MAAIEAILLQDVYSVFHYKKERIRYGRRNEKVRKISDHGNIWIVQSLSIGKNLDPFSVNIEQLEILKHEQNNL